MKKRIAIITGASEGLGKEFVRRIIEERPDEIWVIARNRDKLEALKEEWGSRIVPLAADLSTSEGVHTVCEKLEEEEPTVSYLINNAGTGKMEEYGNCSAQEIEGTIYLNCTAVALLSHACIPYMEQGGHIVNVASQASFQPLPFMTTYAATKVFVRNFTRALNVELQNRKIVATAVCPGWIETDLLSNFSNGENPRFPGQVMAAPVAEKAMRDIKKGKDMSVYTWNVKFFHVLAKLFPQRLTCKWWLWYVKRYVGK